MTARDDVTARDDDALRGGALFAALEPEVAEALIARLTRRSFTAGETVFREGDSGHSLFIVLEGEIELVRVAASGELLHSVTFAPGTWFGEVALLGVTTRAILARARTDARLAELGSRQLHELYRADPRAYALLAMNLARGLARKLQQSEGRLAGVLAATGHRAAPLRAE